MCIRSTHIVLFQGHNQFPNKANEIIEVGFEKANVLIKTVTSYAVPSVYGGGAAFFFYLTASSLFESIVI